jgi:putative transposase
MPRIARIVVADVPYHVTQRGNRREQVFFTADDCRAYLRWLREYADRHVVDILAYCLMPNHVHLVLVPTTAEGLHRALKPLHMRFAQRINRNRGLSGHIWQGRYFSSALDDQYLWAAIRYVERNPVRANMVELAENYRWSSAAAHCGLQSDPVLTHKPVWRELWNEVGNWSVWLSAADEDTQLQTLRRYVDKGLPCGSSEFVRGLEAVARRNLHFRPQGRPTKIESHELKGSVPK